MTRGRAATGHEALLRIEQVSVRYGATVAVRELDLEVAAGEIVGLIGPNGAGKSSTLAAVAGLARIERGEIRVGGVSVTGREPEHIARHGVSLVPENRRIFWNLTVEQNLRVGASTRSDGAAAVQNDMEELISLFPVLRKYLRQPARFLSGGEQQQLAIARALLGRPRLLLLDEPSLGLSPLLVNTVFRTIALLREQGTTILLAEQFVKKTLAVADRVYVMSRGRVTTSGTSSRVRAEIDFQPTHLLGAPKEPA
jgi:branched-chain amino acid transport system ATP-binding protein